MEIKNLRRALLQSEHQERKRLGRLVHDDLLQLIAALRLKSSMYRDSAKVDRERGSHQELVNLADEALTSTRDLVMRLTPPGEHHSSLVEMIRRFVIIGIKISFDGKVDTESLLSQVS